MRNLLITFLLMSMGLFSANAHALFIKTNTTGNLNTSHKVEVFYAEAENGKKEILEDWWSNSKDFTLWLHLPDGTRQKLEVKPEKDHFLAAFTPQLKGNYRLNIHHNIEEKFDNTRYQFNASAQVVVGKEEQTPVNNSDGLSIQTISQENGIKLQVLDQDDKVSEIPVSFHAPNGWKKIVTTNKEGIVNFQPLWDGDYLVETYKVDAVEDEDYNKDYRIITTILSVSR